MNQATLIQLLGVTKVYGQGATALQALKGVDLAIDAGDFVAIMGPKWLGQIHRHEHAGLSGHAHHWSIHF
jgi:putative ABC transport system ATP-binding protein